MRSLTAHAGKIFGILAVAAVISIVSVLPAMAGEVRDTDTTGVVEDNGVCATLRRGQPNIKVDLVEAKPEFDNKVNLTELMNNGERLRRLWLENLRLKELWLVSDLDSAGVAYGAIESIYNFDFSTEPVDQYGAYYCVFFKTASIQLLYRQKVSIPSNITPDSCAYAVVKAHEEMLLDANRKALETYVDRLRQDIPGIIAQVEKGFASKATISLRQFNLQETIREAIDIYLMDTLTAKMKQVIAIVNTPEELELRKAALAVCSNPEKAR
jgi:hypothetical protein